jgi:hypothetical protein
MAEKLNIAQQAAWDRYMAAANAIDDRVSARVLAAGMNCVVSYSAYETNSMAAQRAAITRVRSWRTRPGWTSAFTPTG